MQAVLGPDVHHFTCCCALCTLNSVGLGWFAYSIFKFSRYGVLLFFKKNFRMLVNISNSIFYFFVKQQKENTKKASSKLLKPKLHHQRQKSLVH